jgi:hypothetical protein
MAIDTSHGAELDPAVESWFGVRCSNSLSNSIVNATQACDNNVDTGTAPVTVMFASISLEGRGGELMHS